jgi:hypothetical protein
MASSLAADSSRNQALPQRYQTPHAIGTSAAKRCLPPRTDDYPDRAPAFSRLTGSDRLYLNKLLAATVDASLAFLPYHIEKGPYSIQ